MSMKQTLKDTFLPCLPYPASPGGAGECLASQGGAGESFAVLRDSFSRRRRRRRAWLAAAANCDPCRRNSRADLRHEPHPSAPAGRRASIRSVQTASGRPLSPVLAQDGARSLERGTDKGVKEQEGCKAERVGKAQNELVSLRIQSQNELVGEAQNRGTE